MMRRDRLDHILRAAAGVTGHDTFVLVGSSVIVVRCRNIPGDMLMTREADVYVPDTSETEALSDMIDANIGQGSAFHRQYGYYADGVSPGTSVMPSDWMDRVQHYRGTGCPGVTAIVPDIEDVALAKVVAWREKDQNWILSGVRSRLFSLERMASRIDRMPSAAPEPAEMMRRLRSVAATCGMASALPGPLASDVDSEKGINPVP
ncbi:DUF6036 family nucleotidyltransferase [Methylorubrum rhodesianum]|uniref:DUF6036 family nucleotidyltransferase n=1 Tax=Methylorubrum rhodesianum TaxID=29427 RepID=UPI003D0571E8